MKRKITCRSSIASQMPATKASQSSIRYSLRTWLGNWSLSFFSNIMLGSLSSISRTYMCSRKYGAGYELEKPYSIVYPRCSTRGIMPNKLKIKTHR